MGEVYLAFDTRLQRDVALKVLSDDDADALRRLTREARLASRLTHPFICTVFEAGETNGQAFIAMERVEGEPLSEHIGRGRLPHDRVMRLGAQMAEALAYAHTHGVVHRDFKSANVMVNPDGRIKILDFGIAIRTGAEGQPLTNEVTATFDRGHSLAGTLAYMAPEVLRGEAADARSDIWALGVVLFEMVSGDRPFAGTTPYDLTSAILTKGTPDLAGVPAALQSIIHRCLAKAPGERYQHASEVQAALDAIGSSTRLMSVANEPPVRKRVARAVLAVAIVGVVIAGVIGWRWRKPAPAVAGAPAVIRAIAVLPLANLSGDANQDFFADGMTEALITDLARLKGVNVISRTSVMQFKATRRPLPEIARELSVDAVIAGSVIRSGDRVRVSAQLIEGATDKHLWANDYDRDARDILALQRDVAGAIAREIRATLVTDGAGASVARSVDPAAHDLYLKGRELVYRFNEESIAQAIKLLEEATRIEPTFAEALAALAAAHHERGIWGAVDSRVTGSRAHEAITRALALDSSSSEAYATLGNISMVYDWDWTAAERALKRSIELAPGNARAHQNYAVLLQALRRPTESVAEGIVQQRLDPSSTLAWSALARIQYRARQFDAALDTFAHSIALDPSYVPNYARVADVYLALGRYDEALRSLDRGQALAGGTRRQTDGYGVVYALSGRRREAEAVLADLRRRGEMSDQATYAIALVETALGNRDAAIAALNRAFDAKSATLFLVNSELKFDSLRTDARFQNLLQRMHFPADSTRP